MKTLLLQSKNEQSASGGRIRTLPDVAPVARVERRVYAAASGFATVLPPEAGVPDGVKLRLRRGFEG